MDKPAAGAERDSLVVLVTDELYRACCWLSPKPTKPT
jgi:hypothetical protein